MNDDNPDSSPPPTAEPILIIGAGIAGLTAAHLLSQAGQPVLVVDKGRGVGGRMATRRFGGGRFDHGAQYFTVRDARFGELVEAWQAAGVISEWGWGLATPADPQPTAGHPRYRGQAGMTSVPKFLAQQLAAQDAAVLHLQTRVTAVAKEGDSWLAQAASGETFRGQALLLTPPVPQSLALLEAGQVVLPDDLRADLAAISYHSCLALLALFAGPSKLPAPGGLRLDTGPVAWIADNHQKGISPDGFAVTIHANPDYSRENWSTNAALIAQELIAAGREWLHADLREWQLQRWRYSQVTSTYPEAAIVLSGPPVLAFAGDAFGGPRVEGAALSGYAAAKALLAMGS